MTKLDVKVPAKDLPIILENLDKKMREALIITWLEENKVDIVITD